MFIKDDTEHRTIQHNKEHFSKVKITKEHDDKTCQVKNDNKTRDTIMNGELNRIECGEEDVCQFLKLLKRPKDLMLDEEDCMQVNELKQVVRREKKRSTSSMFSMRDYSVFKCALESE